MSTRPGTPAGVEDILTEILAELRVINAKLGQDANPTTVKYEFDFADPNFDQQAFTKFLRGAMRRGELP